MTQSNERPQSGVVALVAEVEKMLKRRQEETREGNDRRQLRQDTSTTEGLKKWTFDELYHEYGPFRDMRKNPDKYKRPPTSADVGRIADLLLCTLEERNRLLISAGYAPEEPYLQGNELEKALQSTEQLLHYFPVPAYICTRDWNIHRWNYLCTVLFNISNDELSAIPVEERNILRFIFDQNTPVYSLTSQIKERWEYTARLNIYWFKRENKLCQYNNWYTRLIEWLKGFPQFAELWEEVQLGAHYEDLTAKLPFPSYETEIFTPQGEKIRIRGIQMFFVDSEYPRVIGYVPADNESRRIFTQYGFPTPDNRWGYKME